MKSRLTQKRLKEVLDYNLKTGVFRWKITLSCRGMEGSITDCKDKDGYIVIGIDYFLYKAHRLAWLYVHGYFPEHGLDHKDRIKHHNWIDNLREASNQCNIRNTGNRKNNTSGVKGVNWNAKSKKWDAKICVNRHRKYLGAYKEFDNAVCARLAGEQCLDWSGCDSSSPAYQYVQKMLDKTKRKMLHARQANMEHRQGIASSMKG